MKRFLSSAMLIGVVILLAACSLSYNLFDEKPQPTLNLPPSPTSPSPTTVTSPLPTVVIVLPPPKNTEQQITVYFLDLNRFINAIDPYEVAVTRTTTDTNLPLAVLNAYFAGPTQQEYDQGLRMHGSGFTHVRELTISDGVAHVFLGGECANNGAAYSVAALIDANLRQFSDIYAIKIYDENDSTLDPDSVNSSLPYCLEP